LETYSIAHNKENEIKIDNKNDKINNWLNINDGDYISKNITTDKSINSDGWVYALNNDKTIYPDHLGLGNHIVYAGGWATNNNVEHIIHQSAYDLPNKVTFGPDLVNKDKSIIYNLIDSIFANKLFNYTFFVKNLGKFDSFYILDSLTQNNLGRFKITDKWKSEDENKLLGFTIVDTITNKKIYMKDSMNFYSAPLKKVLQDYNCEIKKKTKKWYI
jgi:hypothetical protein